MKINIITSIISIALAALLGYAVYSVAGDDPNADLAFAGCGICTAIELLLAFGVSYEDSRKGVSLRVLSVLAVIVSTIAQFIFAGVGITESYYIIVNGIILLLYLLMFYGLFKAEQQ